MAQSWLFQAFISLMIVSNIVIMSLDKYPMSVDAEQRFQDANHLFTLIFLVEMVIKIIGLGPRQYAMDSFNIFDALIVIVSTAEWLVFEVAFDASSF